jgi:hypothetical protein
MSLAEGPMQDEAARKFSESFIGQERERGKALEWVASLPPGPLRKAVLSSGLTQWLEQASQEAMKLFDGPLVMDLPGDFVGSALMLQAKNGPGTALEWAEKLPAKQRAIARSYFYGGWVRGNFEPAQAYALKLSAGPAREEMISALAKSVAFEQTPRAVAWFRTLSEADQRIAWESFGKVSETERGKIEAALKVP